MKKNTFAKILCLILALAMIAGSAFYLVYIISPASLNVYASDADAYKKLDGLKDILELIDEEYKEDVDLEELVDAAYDGVFSKLDDWSVYYQTEEEKNNFVNSLSNEEYCGIGVTMTGSGDLCQITAVSPDGPAKAAGVKMNDIIIKVDGKSVAGKTLDEIAQMIRGKEGTTVKVTVNRKGESMDFNIKRAKLSASAVSYEMLNETTGYIAITEFRDNCANDVYKAKMALAASGAKSMIIDVRNNPGGYMDEATNSAACFLKDGDPMIYFLKNGKEIDKATVSGNSFGKYKLAVLVNENSASASEAFAAILKDNKVATIVGTTTYGKGVAQQIFTHENGTSVKLSVCYFTGPSKEQIDGVGIKPDFVVYNNGGLTEDEIAEIEANTIAMNEGKKYTKKGSHGLNVLAAQQRMVALGYDVPTNSILDAKTIEAIKDVQKTAGLCPYGGLDFSTIKALAAMYDAYLYGEDDAQLTKAMEVVK